LSLVPLLINLMCPCEVLTYFKKGGGGGDPKFLTTPRFPLVRETDIPTTTAHH